MYIRAKCDTFCSRRHVCLSSNCFIRNQNNIKFVSLREISVWFVWIVLNFFFFHGENTIIQTIEMIVSAFHFRCNGQKSTKQNKQKRHYRKAKQCTEKETVSCLLALSHRASVCYRWKQRKKIKKRGIREIT